MIYYGMVYYETLELFIIPTVRDDRSWPGYNGLLSYLTITRALILSRIYMIKPVMAAQLKP